MAEHLPNKPVGWTFSNQIIRSATSVAANYRAVCRARTAKEFIAKMGVVIEEAEVLTEDLNINDLKKECNELISIFVASIKTVKQRLNRQS